MEKSLYLEWKVARLAKFHPLLLFFETDYSGICEVELYSLTTTNMSPSSLQHYLRTHRKRSGFTQKEIAFLIGTRRDETICRYESFERLPSLETAIAFELVFQKSLRELFEGLYKAVSAKVSARAKAMSFQTKFRHGDSKSNRKLTLLKSLIRGQK